MLEFALLVYVVVAVFTFCNCVINAAAEADKIVDSGEVFIIFALCLLAAVLWFPLVMLVGVRQLLFYRVL